MLDSHYATCRLCGPARWTAMLLGSVAICALAAIPATVAAQTSGANGTDLPRVSGVAAQRVAAMVANNRALSPENAPPTEFHSPVSLLDADVVAKARALSDQAGHNGLHYDYFRFLVAIDKVRQTKADKLDIPKDTYRLYTPQKYPGYRGVIDLSDLSHVTVEGHGSTLLYYYIGNSVVPLNMVDPRAGIHISHSDHLVLRDLVMDWDEPLAVPVTITRDAAGAQSMIIDQAYPIDPKAPPPLTVFLPFDVIHRTFKRSSALSPAAFAAWSAAYKPGGQMPYTCAPPGSGTPSSTCFRYVGGQTYAFGPNEHLSPMPPDPDNFLATVRENNFGAIVVDGGSSFLTIAGVTIYSSPGSGIGLINAGPVIHIVHCRVVRKPDALLRPGEPKRLVSTLSDGMDVITSGGDVVIEDSEIANEADDGLNILSDLRSGQAVSGNTIQATSAAPNNYFKVGELLDIYSVNGRFQVASGAPIISVSPLGGPKRIFMLVLGAGTPALQTGSSYLVRARDWDSTRVLVRNTWFHDNSERGVIVHGSDVAIVNNRFDRTAESAVELLFDDSSGHPEGPPTNNVVVSGNVIHDVNSNWFDPAIRQEAPPAAIAVLFTSRSALGVNHAFAGGNVAARHIAITDNVIDSVPGTGIFVSQAKDVILERNYLTRTGQHAFGIPLVDGRSIVVEEAASLHAVGNTATAAIVLPQR